MKKTYNWLRKNYKLYIINFKLRRGFTLVELLLYMGILSMFISILTSIFISAADVKLESESGSSIQRDGTFILSRLAYDIHRATSVNIPLSIGNESNNLQIIVNGVNYTYIIDADGNLTLADDLGTNNLNSYDSRVSELLIKRLGNIGKAEDIFKINFILTSRIRRNSGFETKSFETNLSLRRQ